MGKEPLERLQTAIHSYPSVESNGGTTTLPPSHSSQYSRKTTTAAPPGSSPPAANHPARGSDGEEKEEIEADASDSTDDTAKTLRAQQKKQYLPCKQTNTSDIDVKQFARRETDYPMTSTESDSDEDDDLELLQTLSQFHGIFNPAPSSDEHRQLSLDAPGLNQAQNLSDFSPNEVSRNGNEMALSSKKNPSSRQILPSSPYIIDTRIKLNDEQEESAEKKNVILSQNLNNDEDGK